jgi:hypothetical protein
MEAEWSTRWQVVLGKSQSKCGWRRSGAQGGRLFSVRVRVSVGGGGVEHKVAAVLSKSQSKRGWKRGVEHEVAGRSSVRIGGRSG